MSSHTLGYAYSHLTKNMAKQPHLWDLPWVVFPRWSFKSYAHSYLQNIWCNEDPRFCDILLKWNGKQKGMEHNIIPNVAGVVIDGGVLHIHFLEQVLVFVPFHQGLHIASFTFQKNWNTCMWYVCDLNGSHFVYTSMFCTNCPHQVHIWKRWMQWVLDFDGVWFGRCLMLEMEICQIHAWKPPLQCYGFPHKNTIIFQLRPYNFSCTITFITQSTMC